MSTPAVHLGSVPAGSVATFCCCAVGCAHASLTSPSTSPSHAVGSGVPGSLELLLPIERALPQEMTQVDDEHEHVT